MIAIVTVYEYDDGWRTSSAIASSSDAESASGLPVVRKRNGATVDRAAARIVCDESVSDADLAALRAAGYQADRSAPLGEPAATEMIELVRLDTGGAPETAVATNAHPDARAGGALIVDASGAVVPPGSVRIYFAGDASGELIERLRRAGYDVTIGSPTGIAEKVPGQIDLGSGT